ncbi:helicase HerA-like domain-containing protein [Macrococcus capreoli]|uniref:helicase HerA-like domain-containing protein n=1 Tax=Macrococcus capreoli TaxID=2982690 RepID=UPI003F41B84E
MTSVNIAKNENDITLQLQMANRHGLIAGATGTGKTVTLKVLAEQFSKNGVPVFLADIKGDLASIAEPMTINEKIQQRLTDLNITDYAPASYPVRLWDIFGTDGAPVRATITEMGPLLLARLLELNDTQTGVLNIAFKISDDNGLLLLDLKDLQALLKDMADNASTYSSQYGNITKQSVGSIQRKLLAFESQGGQDFFGEPALSLTDFMEVSPDGKGMINVLMANNLYTKPILYSTFLLWLLTELFEELPEVGDMDKPKLVFFFDEAHLLFKDAPSSFVTQVEQVVRLVRSKGVGVYFITQNPIDLPDEVLGQLGNRVQHALRSFTPRDQKAVKSAAETFRQNPDLDVASVIGELKTGEALISCLNEDGQASIVQRAFIRPPESKIGVIDPTVKQSVLNQNPYQAKYGKAVDRESAYEMLQQKFTAVEVEQQKAEQEKVEEKTVKAEKRQPKSELQKVATSVLTSVGRQIGREIVRNLFGGRRR